MLSTKEIISGLSSYAKELGPYFPLNCGNPLVAGQYALPLKIITKYLKPESRILDWGCGGGHFSYLLMQEKYSVHSFAYESSEDLQMVKRKAETQFNGCWNHFHSQDPITLPFQENSFDGVISLGVLEHVRETGGNERGSLQEFYRILKPGGFFLCFHFPNRYSWIEAASRALKKIHIPKFCHSYLYTKKGIFDLLHATEFRMLELEKYNFFPRRMLRLIPDKFAWNPLSFHAYDAVEKIFALFLGALSQNYYFVLQK